MLRESISNIEPKAGNRAHGESCATGNRRAPLRCNQRCRTCINEEGDQALIAFANILNDVFGSVGTVIRFAGDEFVVLMHKAKESDIDIYKQKTADAVDQYNKTSGKPYQLSAAVGGKVFDFSKEDTQDLVVVIDTLMYKDKDDYYKDHKKER